MTEQNKSKRTRAPRRTPEQVAADALAAKRDALAVALAAAPSLERMAAIMGVSGKGTFRPFVRAKIGHVSRDGLAIAKTPDALALILDKFADGAPTPA
jgi:hypothetical protein